MKRPTPESQSGPHSPKQQKIDIPEDVPMEVDEKLATIPDSSNVLGLDPIMPQALTTVSAERDKMSDAEHKDLDNLILELFSAFEPDGNGPQGKFILANILANITFEDERLKKFGQKDATELIKKNPQLEDLLKEAWRKRSFKEIRRLGLNVSAFFVIGQLIEHSTSLAANATQR